MLHRITAAVVGLLFFTSVSVAEFPEGFAEDGYTFSAKSGIGLWYDASGGAFTRTRVETAGYWTGGRWYCGRYCYGYYVPGKYYYSYSAYTAPKVDYKTPGWRDILAKEAARIARDRQEQQAFMEAVRELGLQNSFAVPHQHQSYQSSSYGSGVATASTLYGYGGQASYSSLSGFYDTNLDQLWQMASQHVINAQSLGGEATSQFQESLKLEGSQRAKVAEWLAKGEVASRIITALREPSSFSTVNYKFSFGPNGEVITDSGAVPQETKTTVWKSWRNLAEAKCAACHSGAKKRGNFDVLAYPSLVANQRNAVLARITSADPAKIMPRSAQDERQPGAALTAEEIRLFVLVEGQEAISPKKAKANGRSEKPVP